MRKLGSEADAEKKRKRNTLILSLIMLVVLVGGTAGYAFISNPNDRTSGATGGSNSSSLARSVGNRWVVNVDGKDLSFANSPESVADIPVNITASITTYAGLSLYLAQDNSAINTEIATTLGHYASKVQRACYGPCKDDLPEKSCSDNLIIWKDGPQNQVYQKENCIFIEGDLRAVDAFLYNVLKIRRQ